MEKEITGTVMTLLAVAAIETDPGVKATNIQKPMLHAYGTQPSEQGRVRIAIPAEGGMYEVIIAKPGEPKLLPAANNDTR